MRRLLPGPGLGRHRWGGQGTWGSGGVCPGLFGEGAVLPAPPRPGHRVHIQGLSASMPVPLLLPKKGSPGEESFFGIKAGDEVARHQEELIGDQESKEAELVLQGDVEWLFLAEGPGEHGPPNFSTTAGWQRLSTSPTTRPLTIPFGEGRASCRRCCLMPRTAAWWGAGARLWEANLRILAWREAKAPNQWQ